MPIDLRSDTVTQPTESMRQAMGRAPVGDDVFGEDPTIIKLEKRLAEQFGHEAGLFCPSGTMTNQIAINVHTQPGDEVICSADAHIYKYEGGGIMVNSGCSVKFTNDDRGQFKADQLPALCNPKEDPHLPLTRLVSIENTFNRGGGAVWNLEDIRAISTYCRSNNLAFHLDGARIYNALVATSVSAEEMGAFFDTISICLSKGLGAPVGSVLLGSKEHIAQALRVRKRLGGGMRQAGILAAAGLFALDNNVERLALDHARAQRLAQALAELPFVSEVLPVETNIVVFRVGNISLVKDILNKLEQKGILGIPFGVDMIRFVTHLDISDSDIDTTIEALKSLAR